MIHLQAAGSIGAIDRGEKVDNHGSTQVSTANGHTHRWSGTRAICASGERGVSNRLNDHRTPHFPNESEMAL